MTIVWDWNGTLLDDTRVSLDALNEIFAARGLAKISLDFYRENFSFPVKPFYAQCGFNLATENWAQLARDYHDAYLSRQAELFRDARAALELARAGGFRQVVLSNLRQDYLDCAIDHFKIRDFFVAIRGSDNMDGGSKLALAKKFAMEVASDPRELVFVGDSLHDYEVATAAGAACILFGGGSHEFSRLARVAKTVGTLTDAVREIENLHKQKGGSK